MKSDLELRLRLGAVVVIYISCLVYAYVAYLSPFIGDIYFPEFDAAKSSTALSIAVASVMVFASVLPPRITSYSDFVIWFLFFYLFSPVVLYVPLQGLEPDGGTSLVLYLVVSFAAIAAIPTLVAANQRRGFWTRPAALTMVASMRLPIRHQLHMPLLIIYVVCVTALLVTYGDMMKLTSFYEVYDQRALASEIGGNRNIIAYVGEWLPRLIAPFMLAVGLMYKKKLYIVLALLAFLICYTTFATKYIPALVVLMVLLHYFVLNTGDVLAERIGIIAAGGIVLPLIIVTIYGFEFDDTLDILVSQTLERVYGNPGALIGKYSQFFSINPLTYYSHVGMFSWFLDYPYGDLSLGRVMGLFIAGTTDLNANAGFWASDGIAALYHPGIIVISVLLGAVIAVFNNFVPPTMLHLACLSSIASIWILVDGSLFGVMFGGGWPLHIVLVNLFYNRPERDRAGNMISLPKI